MKALKEKILTEGYVQGADILKVDAFLNHQIDCEFMSEIGAEFKRRFSDKKIDKILTIEASGIAIACMTAPHFGVPVVFAKKTESRNLDADTYESQVYSFTKDKTYTIRVSKKYIQPGEKVLILDDFLANGKALEGLTHIVKQAGGSVEGIGIVIEKGFQPGGDLMRDQGMPLESLAIIEEFNNGEVVFR